MSFRAVAAKDDLLGPVGLGDLRRGVAANGGGDAVVPADHRGSVPVPPAHVGAVPPVRSMMERVLTD